MSDPSSPITKVLLAEASESVRGVLCEVLRGCGDIRVIAEAGSGRDALGLTRLLKPDLVILDPTLKLGSGAGIVAEIMIQAPTRLLLLIRNGGEAEVSGIHQGLPHGLLQVMERPLLPTPGAWRELGPLLIEKVRQLSGTRASRQVHDCSSGPQQKAQRPQPTLLAIGASTGGPKAVMSLLTRLPADLAAAVFVVQHIADGCAAGFAQWLDRGCALKVRLAREGDPVTPGQALVAPDGCHMTLRSGKISLAGGTPVNCCRPSIDVFFESLATEPCGHLVGVLLTGMGKDGARGLLQIKEQGGRTWVQDEKSCAIFGMPKAAIKLGAADEVLPLEEIAARLPSLFQK